MKDNKLTTVINKPAQVIFDYTLNPENTPKWIDGIASEETNEWPVKIGSTYKNTNGKDDWNHYELTELVDGKTFTLTSVPDFNLFVKYTFTKIDDNSTQFDYHEWVEQAPLEHVFTQSALEKLKSILEAKQ